MLKAECILRGARGTQVDVDAMVNRVRARAALLPIVNVLHWHSCLMNAEEEFAGEGLRWFGLQRSGNLVTIMNAWRTVEDATLLTRWTRLLQILFYILFLPSQLDAAPGLYKYTEPWILIFASSVSSFKDPAASGVFSFCKTTKKLLFVKIENCHDWPPPPSR